MQAVSRRIKREMHRLFVRIQAKKSYSGGKPTSILNEERANIHSFVAKHFGMEINCAGEG